MSTPHVTAWHLGRRGTARRRSARRDLVLPVDRGAEVKLVSLFSGIGLIDLGFHRAGRLQGAPDGWTDGQADSPRYKQLGNSVAVPVFEWVARRLVEVDAERAA